MRRLAAAARCLALSALLAGGAWGGGAPESITEDGSVDRRAMTAGGVLVVSTENGTPTATVCAAPVSAALGAADAVEVARRGGRASVERIGDVDVRCVSVPSAELPFALGIVQRASPSPEDAVEAPEAAREMSTRRLTELALEGATTRPGDEPGWVLAVVGPSTATEVLALVHAGTPSVAVRSRPYTWSLRQESERLSVMEASLAVPAVRFGWAIPSPSPDEQAALSTAIRIIGGGERSRATRLIAERGLARHVDSWSLRLRGGDLAGMWLELSSRVSADRVRRFTDGIVRQLRTVGPTEREVDAARARLIRDELERWEDPEKRSRTLAWYEFAKGDASLWPEELRGLSRVTPSSVRSTVRKAFVDARRTTVEIYPHLWPADDPAVSHATLYTVAKGDTLADLALRFRVTTVALARANDLEPTSGLVPGEPLWVPTN